MLPKGHFWTLLSSLDIFASERKHGKAHRVPTLVNGTCRFIKGEFGELVADAQVWWPYVVAHVDQTSIFACVVHNKAEFSKQSPKDMCYAEIWTMCSKHRCHSRLNCLWILRGPL